MFQDATFADMLRRDGPMIVINASDLARGVRFSFLQDYFDLLCSGLSPFPVARALTASSAVPVLFNPVVVKNYPDCGSKTPQLLEPERANRSFRRKTDAWITAVPWFGARNSRMRRSYCRGAGVKSGL